MGIVGYPGSANWTCMARVINVLPRGMRLAKKGSKKGVVYCWVLNGPQPVP